MNVVDLFCGGGGMSLGFEKAGYKILTAYDNWEKAINVYNDNFSHPAYMMDLSDVDKSVSEIKHQKPDIIIGGPPCQDFSSAGKRDVTLGRADLTYSYANIVCAIKPQWFVMENVERIRKSHILNDIVEQFKDNQYGLTAVILNASYCNVPQARNRFFLIGQLNGKHNSLLEIMKNMLSDSPMNIRDYLGDSLGLEYYYRHPRNYSRRGVFSIDEPSPTVRGVNRPVPQGYEKHTGDPINVCMQQVRPLTTIERSYIQTFPKTFIFNGTKTTLEQIIGNAVPVNLAEFVAKSILKYIQTHKVEKNKSQSFQHEEAFKIPERALHKEII
jgi:DNA (cytosine-5)-methyltransferase 1